MKAISSWLWDEGAELVIDGRGRILPGHEEGFFLWPTLIDYAAPSMKSYQDEILVQGIAVSTGKREMTALRKSDDFSKGCCSPQNNR